MVTSFYLGVRIACYLLLLFSLIMMHHVVDCRSMGGFVSSMAFHNGRRVQQSTSPTLQRMIATPSTPKLSPSLHHLSNARTQRSPTPFIRNMALSSSTEPTESISNNNNDKLISLQKQLSTEATMARTTAATTATTISDEQEHLNHQKNVFDNLVPYFSSKDAVPEDLVPVYQHLAQRIMDAIIRNTNHNGEDTTSDDSTTTTYKILDVACGAGVLWEFLADDVMIRQSTSTTKNKIRLQITGIDVSSNMVEAASERADELFEEYMTVMTSNKKKVLRPQHSFQVIESDIGQYKLPERQIGIETVKEYDASKKYDAVLLNACFGNFYNQSMVMEQIVNNLMKPPLYSTNQTVATSTVFITHPLGADFVTKLHTEDPITVPYTLPTTINEWINLSMGLPIELMELSTHPIEISTTTDTQSSYPFYLLAAKRTRAQMVSNVMTFRGPVDRGYGRGGKKLGFPTANLPSRCYQDALQDLPNGVYFGWAIIESDETKRRGRNVLQKAVVNIGLSPTFEGQENPEKIIEAHLILPKNGADDTATSSFFMDPPDFYGETMRLQLAGYLRPEKKFKSLDALMEQISTDVSEADHALTFVEPYNSILKLDPFLLQHHETKDNNDESSTTSWEFRDMRTALNDIINRKAAE